MNAHDPATPAASLQPIILTRRYAATPSAKARVIARWGDHHATVLWRDNLTSFHNHERAACALAIKYALRGEWMAAPRDDKSWVFMEPSTATLVDFFRWG